MVTTAEDRLAGPDSIVSKYDLDEGTKGLSLREAITMANNSPKTDLIIFDSEVFAQGASTEIVLGSALPTISDAFTTIDAGSNRVQVVAASSAALRIEASDVLIEGLAFVSSDLGSVLHVEAAENVELRNNTFVSAGTAISGIEVDGLQIVGNDFRDAAADAITIAGATDLVVSFNHFEDLGDRALRVAEADSAIIENNALLHVGGTQMTIADSVGVDVQRNTIVIDNKTSQKGVRFEGVTDSRIADNFIDPGSAHLVSLSNSSDNFIEGNILDRGDAGVVLEGESARNMVFRNVIIGSAYDGIYVSSAALDNTVVHNTIHNASSALVFGNETVIEGNNLITADEVEEDEGEDDEIEPFEGYVDAAGYDFRLAPGSPFIDAGEELGYDCVPGAAELFWDAAPDLGAIETHLE